MVSRALALPAVACLVLGAVLGVWGWGQRDEARARIVPEEEVVEDGGLFGPAPLPDGERLAQTCASLRAASRVERPPVDPLGTGPDSPADPILTGFALMAVLDPDIVLGLAPLDRPDVRSAIEDERRAVDVVVSGGGDVTSDPEVARTAAVLGLTLDGTC